VGCCEGIWVGCKDGSSVKEISTHSFFGENHLQWFSSEHPLIEYKKQGLGVGWRVGYCVGDTVGRGTGVIVGDGLGGGVGPDVGKVVGNSVGE
jgi:hypothetical protein